MLGTCCAAHLTTMVRAYALNSQNGAVTVKVTENPYAKLIEMTKLSRAGEKTLLCNYCYALTEFNVTYHPKADTITADQISTGLSIGMKG